MHSVHYRCQRWHCQRLQVLHGSVELLTISNLRCFKVIAVLDKLLLERPDELNITSQLLSRSNTVSASVCTSSNGTAGGLASSTEGALQWQSRDSGKSRKCISLTMLRQTSFMMLW